MNNKEIENALLDAFPSYSSLERMVKHQLNENLEAITGRGTLQDEVFNLVIWAQAQGRLWELVNGAQTENPGNPKLKKLKISIEDSIDSDIKFFEQDYLNGVIRRFNEWKQTFTHFAPTISASNQIVTEFIDLVFNILLTKDFGIPAISSDYHQKTERVPASNLQKILEKYPRIILLGEAGSGKTTILWRIALKQAEFALKASEAKFPVILELGTFSSKISFEEWVISHLSSLPSFERRLDNGKFLFLFDGLNEMSKSERGSNETLLQEFMKKYTTCSYLVSCRKNDYNNNERLERIQLVEIKAMNEQQIKKLIDKYKKNRTATKNFLKSLENDYPELLELSTNPYYLTLILRLSDWGQSLPKSRGQLFSSIVDELLRREEKRYSYIWQHENINSKWLKDMLSKLAFEMQITAGRNVVEMQWVEELLKQIDTTRSAESFLRLAAGASIIAIDENEKLVRFRHQRLLEFFTSLELQTHISELSKYCSPPLFDHQDVFDIRPGKPLSSPQSTAWDDIIIMLAGYHSEVSNLVQQITSVNPLLGARCIIEGQARVGGQTLAEVQQRLLGIATNPDFSTRERLQAGHFLGQLGDLRFSLKGGVIIPPIVDISAETYSIGGIEEEISLSYPDEKNRHKVPTKRYSIGQFAITNREYQCFIDSKGYDQDKFWSDPGWAWRCGTMGNELKQMLVKGYLAVREQCRKERARLVEHSIEYKTLDTKDMDAWWSILMHPDDVEAEKLLHAVAASEWKKEHKLPVYWNDPAFKNPNQPVIVSWFEADAYCNWLSSHAFLKVAK